MSTRTTTFWPSARQFAEAVQCPAVCFGEPTLKGMLPAVDRLGMPLVTSGQFAYVFKLNPPGGGGESLAVRCFRGFLGDRERRYSALDAHLNARHVPALPRFRYLPEGMLVSGHRFPTLVMDWVAGPTLDVYVDEVVGQREVLLHLADEWLRLMESLRAADVAHGDLQHGNVIVERGRLRLVDLDGMYVPALEGMQSSEVGHRHYQHPARGADFFSREVDNFSAAVVYLSLIALAERPSLWAEHHDENLLFTRADFQDPAASALFAKVSDIGMEHAALAGVLADSVKSEPTTTPWLLDLVQVKSKLPTWMTAPAEVDVVGRTREAARDEIAAGAVGAHVWEPKRGRYAPSSPSSNTVQTIFGARPAPSSIVRDPTDVVGNTFRFVWHGFTTSLAFLWVTSAHSAIRGMILTVFGGGGAAATVLSIFFLVGVFLVYGIVRALYEMDTAARAQAQGVTPLPPSAARAVIPAAGGQPLFGVGRPATPAGPRRVVGSRSLNIFHRPTCVWADKITPRNHTEFVSPAAAQQAGYRACRVCMP